MMMWAMLLIIAAIVLIMVMNNRSSVPWGRKMRRVQPGVSRKVEWMAPEDVVDQVREDYLSAVHWLQDQMLASWQHQWTSAPSYLSGTFLRRFQYILSQQGVVGRPRGIGVLRSDHEVTVRHFSEDGACCLIVDQQAQRRMATYDSRTHERVMTQDLGDGALVYQMRYDQAGGRWKIDEFVQELPAGWGQCRSARRIQELAALPPALGRDN